MDAPKNGAATINPNIGSTVKPSIINVDDKIKKIIPSPNFDILSW